MELHILQSPGLFTGDLQKAREIVEHEALEMPVLPGYQEFGNKHQQKVFQPLPDYVLEIGPLATQVPRARDYLKYRGYDPDEVVQAHGLRYDHEHDRLVFPYWDVHGRLAGMRGRGIQFPGEIHWTPHHDYVWNGVNNSQLTWYNEQVLNLPGPVIVVEGQFDCLRVSRVWKKTVANLTAKPVLAKMLKLTHSEGVVLLLDGDDTGRAATKKYIQYCVVMSTPVYPIYLPVVDEHGAKQKTDPDKLGEAWVVSALTTAGLLTNHEKSA
jgi:DNA primase